MVATHLSVLPTIRLSRIGLVLSLLLLPGLVSCRQKPDRVAEARRLLSACEARLALLPVIDAKVPELVLAGPKPPDFATGPHPLKLAWGQNEGSPSMGYNAVLVTRRQITKSAPKTVADTLGTLGSYRFLVLMDKLAGVRAALTAVERGEQGAAAKLAFSRMDTGNVTDVRYLVLAEPTAYVAPRLSANGGEPGFIPGKVTLLALVFDLADGGRYVGSVAVETWSDSLVKFKADRRADGRELVHQGELQLGMDLVKKAGSELAKRLAAL